MTMITMELLSQYRDAAIGNADPDLKRANRCHDIVHACYKKLRETEDGRRGIMSLMEDENPYVRGWAAAHSLAWDPQTARCVLEEIRDADGPGAVSAKWTLIEFDKGRLSFDY